MLLKKTALDNKYLILLNIASSILHSLTEAITLGLVYLAIESISSTTKAINDTNFLSLPLIKDINNFLVNLKPNSYFISILLIIIIIQILQFISKYICKLTVNYFSAKCRVTISSLIHKKVLNLSFSSASKYKIGDLGDYVIQSPLNIRKHIEITFDIFIHLVLIFTYILIMIKISLYLLVAVILLILIISPIQRNLIPRIKNDSIIITNKEVGIISNITENFQGLRFLHSNGLLNKSIKNINNKLNKLEENIKLQAIKLSFIEPFSSLLPIPIVSLIAIGNLLIYKELNQDFLASFITFILALQRLNTKLTIITSHQNTFSENYQRITRINNLLNDKNDARHNKNLLKIKDFKNNIQFKNISLQYSDTNNKSLQDINFKINRGEKIALVGPSGSGKSSISDLLLGIFSPTSGNIFIDDINFKNIDLESWRSLIGVVSQDTFLFNTSIEKNISFGLENVNFQEIVKASKLAKADEFITKFPYGYKTIIGERGYKLSGGQRQKIALARAFLKDPKIFILDEATSALDSKSEKLIQESLRENAYNSTFFTIAHRLSTIKDADNILVIENGYIKESGTHNELILKNGLYKNLWEIQSLKKEK